MARNKKLEYKYCPKCGKKFSILQRKRIGLTWLERRYFHCDWCRQDFRIKESKREE